MALAGLLRRHGCLIQAWVVGWALSIFLSAAVRTIEVERVSGIGMWAGAIFETADAVPPAAKLSLGALIALGFAAARAFGTDQHRCALPLWTTALATAAAIAVILALPISYYPYGGPSGWGWIALHLLSGAVAGAAAWQVARACCRRKARRS